MSLGPAPRYHVVHPFLDPALADPILSRALDCQSQFAQSQVLEVKQGQIAPDHRLSWRSDAGLGELEPPFLAAVKARFDDLCRQAGLAPFDVARCETEVVAHGDGGFYRPHLDTFTQADRDSSGTDRALTLVWYFNREPQAWSGGELQLYRFGGGLADSIAPRHNMLVAFPSIVLHEVRPVAVPSGRFEDCRFAVNCWLHRARQ